MPNPPPQVILRQSWVVLAFCEDEYGEYGVDDEEFENQAEAIVRAAQQADRYGVDIQYGWYDRTTDVGGEHG